MIIQIVGTLKQIYYSISRRGEKPCHSFFHHKPTHATLTIFYRWHIIQFSSSHTNEKQALSEENPLPKKNIEPKNQTTRTIQDFYMVRANLGFSQIRLPQVHHND